MKNPIGIGDTAPDFDLPTNSNGRTKLKDYHGKNLVLYFYPKDDTSGCTKQAISFTEHFQTFTDMNTAILGVSKDSPASHDKFISKHNLGITLASDESLETCQAYGVWVEKNMYGRKYMGVERSTFLLGADGKILQAWRKVRVSNHIETVLEAIRMSIS